MDRAELQEKVEGSKLAQSLLWRAGAAVAVVEGDEVQTVTLGRGVDADTPVEVGSVTKPFTGLLLAEAVLRWELTLGSRVDEVVFSERWEGTPAITAGELAAQVSGLPRLSLPVPRRLHLDPYAAAHSFVALSYAAEGLAVRCLCTVRRHGLDS